MNLGVTTTAAGGVGAGQLSVAGSKLIVTWPSPVRLLAPEEMFVAPAMTVEAPNACVGAG